MKKFTNKLFNRPIGYALTWGLGLMLVASGCSTGTSINNVSLDQVKQTAQQAVEQAKELSQSEVAKRLTEDLQKRIDKLKIENNRLVTPDGKINWAEAQKTELVEHSFFTVLDWEYKASMKADGNVEVIRIDLRSGEKKVLQTYKVRMENGQVILGN